MRWLALRNIFCCSISFFYFQAAMFFRNLLTRSLSNKCTVCIPGSFFQFLATMIYGLTIIRFRWHFPYLWWGMLFRCIINLLWHPYSSIPTYFAFSFLLQLFPSYDMIIDWAYAFHKPLPEPECKWGWKSSIAIRLMRLVTNFSRSVIQKYRSSVDFF